jgi:hypothetical protein
MRWCKSGVDEDWWIEIFLGVRNCPWRAFGDGVRARIAVKMCVVGEETDEEIDLGVAGDCTSGGVTGVERRAGCTSAEGDTTLGGRGEPGVGVDGRSDGCVISRESEVLDRALIPVDRSRLAFGDFGLFA